MLDAVLQNRPIARRKSDVLARLALEPGRYALVTVHRAGNTDEPERLMRIVEALNRVPERVVFPAHPRTRQALGALRGGACFADHVQMIEPVGYFDMMILEENARLIATDSGGVQREAYFLGVPCLTLRDETEWVETARAGWNQLVGAQVDHILDAWLTFKPPAERPPIFGDGTAGQRIANILDVEFRTRNSQLMGGLAR
jgi:UDP-N-acetylglucosamine 2-epimerase